MVCTCRLALIYVAAVTLTLFFVDPPNATGAMPQNTGSSASPQQDVPYVFRATTREVVVDVIAVDAHDRPVLDLVPSNLHVFEEIGVSHRIPEDISSLRIIDPISTNATEDTPQAGFRIAGNGSCLERASVHYELAYHPGAQGWTSGYHQVLIKTNRRGVKLFFRHSYYIGETSPAKASGHKDQGQLEKELVQSACGHPTVPLSISLRAALIATGSTDVLRYSINIESGSLAFVSFSDNGRQLQLDYGACNFDAAGQPLNYMRASTDQVLTSVEYARVLAHGFHRFFEFPVPKGLAMTRFVVRDRETGNLGAVDILSRPEGLPNKAPASLQDPASLSRLRDALRETAERTYVQADMPPDGPLGSFGSVVPNSRSLCGDVYELPSNTRQLPDYRALDPIGSIYTDALAVPWQVFTPTSGIPGVTNRTEWFGVDYHGTFWVRNPGEYDFKLISDDGAILQIDDTRVIELDGIHFAWRHTGKTVLDAGLHTIHVPYFEGPMAVALVLWVKPPGGDWKIFDVQDFASPSSTEPTTQAPASGQP